MNDWLITVHITLEADDEHQALERIDAILGETPDSLADLQYESVGCYQIVLPIDDERSAA